MAPAAAVVVVRVAQPARRARAAPVAAAAPGWSGPSGPQTWPAQSQSPWVPVAPVALVDPARPETIQALPQQRPASVRMSSLTRVAPAAAATRRRPVRVDPEAAVS